MFDRLTSPAIFYFTPSEQTIAEESFRLIDLRFTDIILGDTPQKGLLYAIMSILSQDAENAEYMYTDKNKMQADKNVVIGMPVFIYTRVIDDTKNPRAEEVFRRFVNVTPNLTKQRQQQQQTDHRLAFILSEQTLLDLE